MKYFDTIKFLKLIKRFNKICNEVELRPILVPNEILEKYYSWKEFQYLNSDDLNTVMLKTIGYYGERFNTQMKDILSFDFFNDFLTFYEYYSQARIHKKIKLNNSAQRIRFIRTVLEEAVKLKLTSSKRKNKLNTIDSLYTSFIAISNFSNRLSTNTILNIQSASIKKNNINAELVNSSTHSLNIKIAMDFIRQCSGERYLNENYSRMFFSKLALIGLEEKELYSKIANIYKAAFLNERLPLVKFEKIISKQGKPFKYLIDGMVLKKEYLDDITERIRKPNSATRQLYYPFLIWDIDDKKYVIIENRAFVDGFQYAIGDRLTNGVMPKTWKHLFSKDIIRELNQGIDFENYIESFIKETKIDYLREIKIKSESRLRPDFVIYDKEKNQIIFLECKNFMKRSDPNSWINDYWEFCSKRGKNSYNDKADKVLELTNIDNSLIIKRFKTELNLNIINPKLKYMFIVNSPTLYMFSSKYLIVTWKMFYDMLKIRDFSGDMFFESEKYFIHQNIRFLRHDITPKQIVNKITGGGIFVH